VTAQPARPNASDRAASDPAPLIPTTTDRIAANPVTAREIAEFLRHLAELSHSPRGGDPGARAAFLARKAELFTRLGADPTTPASPPAPQRRTS
jgi:hypothetical protein